MRAIKQHSTEPNRKQLPYNSLHHCLEAHFGQKRSPVPPIRYEHREAEQGLRTVPFQSRYPLQLDYMRRRKTTSLIQKLLSKEPLARASRRNRMNSSPVS